MNDTSIVRAFERLSDLQRDSKRLFERQRTTGNPLLQRYAINQLDDEVIRADIMQCADVRVIQRRDGSCLTLEGIGENVESDLDGYEAVKPRVARLVDLAHTSGADRLNDLVGTERFAGAAATGAK